MTTWTKGPFDFRLYALSDEDVEQARALGLPPTRIMNNDGSVPIMAGSEDDRKVVAYATCQTPFKRGEGWRAKCEERDANAHLFAAAPDLAEALDEAINFLAVYAVTAKDEQASALLDKCTAALSRAEGKS